MEKPKSITQLSKEQLEDMCLNLMHVDKVKTEMINHLEEKEELHLNRIDELTDRVVELETNNNTAINFIDQVLQYHLSPFEYKQVDEDINTLIGILRSGSNE